MPKRQSFDVMKYLPLALLAVSSIAGYVTLQNAQANDSKRLDKVEIIQDALSKDTGEIRVSQAKTETKLDAIYEAVKSLKK